MAKKKILLIMPDAHMHKLKIGRHVRSMREAPLSMASLAALAPKDLDLDFTIIDGSVEQIPYDFQADLVGISIITGTAKSGYKIADHFRKRNIPVVIGGVHATILPEEAQEHADSLVIGMAEQSWPQLLRDFFNGKMQKRYIQEVSDSPWLMDIPTPRLDLMRYSGYMIPNSIQATRGCSNKCDFCSVPSVWHKFQKRPVADVIRDIKATPGFYIGFGDVNLIDDVEHAKELFRAMIPLKKYWGGLATSDVTEDPELFDLIVKSGCRFLLIGFESSNQQTLNRIAKGFNNNIDYRELVYKLHQANISVQGCFVFGFDHDDKSIFKETVDRCIDLKIDIPRYSIYTPYPGTRLHERLAAEGRIVSTDWNDYDTMHVVHKPLLMTAEELYDGFKWAYKETFRFSHILRRTARLSMACPVNIVGNMAYRIFVRRLYNEPRFTKPYHFSQEYQKEEMSACM